MNCLQYTNNKIHTATSIKHLIETIRFAGKKIVFTNGCFDILHQGHLQILHQAAAFGHYLIVGVNTDASVKRLKGDSRPINDAQSRAMVLANMMVVDAVFLFEEDTPLELIKALQPNVLVKGGDYTIDKIVGANEVKATGGTVEIIPTLQGFSTTGIFQKMHTS